VIKNRTKNKEPRKKTKKVFRVCCLWFKKWRVESGKVKFKIYLIFVCGKLRDLREIRKCVLGRNV